MTVINLDDPAKMAWAVKTGIIFHGTPEMIAAGAKYLIENPDVPIPDSVEEPTRAFIEEKRNVPTE
jgi:hypothetical protein